MTIQEAYIKGLDDAENKVIEILERVIRGEDVEIFPNPKLEELRKVVKARSDYYISLAKRNNNIGKTFRKRIAEELENIDKSKI